MNTLWKYKSLLLGQDDSELLRHQLEASAVPVSDADCRTCPNPCDEGHDGYPKRFNIDTSTRMLGSVKAYRRQVVISTGKSDWERNVTEVKDSLAYHLCQVQKSHEAHSKRPISPQPNGKAVHPLTGVFKSSDSTHVSILNGNHDSLSCTDNAETVLVLPDYKIVSEVPRSLEGAQNLWDSAVDPDVGRFGASLEKTPLKTWVIPYACVILLCSHKRRDNRCAIAAPKLERAFIQSLEANGWTVDTHLEEPSITLGPPIEEFSGTTEERDNHILDQLKEVATTKKVLIVRNSHMGGHKYAGNCILYTPQGSSIWYGRVSPHEVESIVQNTILDGLVLPPLLRGGLNISRPGCSSLHDW
ncbi:hypothetical protein AX16_000184 [Volvariella volvacea WC 439]|nr:hypothetical protein AX16_000184 [Volvariella volvacea WC 439]